MIPGLAADHRSSNLQTANQGRRKKRKKRRTLCGEATCVSVAFLLPDVNHHEHVVGTRFASSAVDIVVDEDGDDNGAFRVEVIGIVVRLVAHACKCS